MAVSPIPTYVKEEQNYLHYKKVNSRSSINIGKGPDTIYLLISYSNSDGDFGLFRIAGANVNLILGKTVSDVTVTATSDVVSVANGKSYMFGFLIFGTIT